jgi:hypothetical protein
MSVGSSAPPAPAPCALGVAVDQAGAGSESGRVEQTWLTTLPNELVQALPCTPSQLLECCSVADARRKPCSVLLTQSRYEGVAPLFADFASLVPGRVALASVESFSIMPWHCPLLVHGLKSSELSCFLRLLCEPEEKSRRGGEGGCDDNERPVPAASVEPEDSSWLLGRAWRNTSIRLSASHFPAPFCLPWNHRRHPSLGVAQNGNET